MSTAVITIVAGRHDHLLHQQQGLATSRPLPDIYVVVGMNDPVALQRTEDGPLAGTPTLVRTELIQGGGPLPLARARNVGAAAALAAGADRLVFLDVDCVPTPGLIHAYSASMDAAPAPALHCGVVRYLGPEIDVRDIDLDAPPGEPHPARPQPAAGRFEPSEQWQLFWSLSFAVTADTWRRLGGFHEEYTGYGGEDTDFGRHAHELGIDLIWVGGADALHQYHPTTPLPVQHLTDILRNSAIFHRRWGFWPMSGWLNGFAAAGLAGFDPVTGRWVAGPPA